MKKDKIWKSTIAASIFLLAFYFLVIYPSKSNASTLTSASAALSNPRLSFRALSSAGSSGTSSITISSSTSYPDFNTNNLFGGDNVCFTNEGLDGCIGDTYYSVATISGATTFSVSSPLTNDVDASGYAIATQSGNLTLTFTLVSAIPAGGDILIRIPVASTGDTNDGFPDTGTTNTTNGFDFNKLEPTSVQVTTSGGTCSDGWDTPVVASASGTITITKSTSVCTGSTVTIVVPNLVNPTPYITNHTQGTADTYKIGIITRDGSDNQLDTTNVMVAPIEGVFVSATVDQTLSFTVEGVDTGQTACGATTNVGTTAFAVPWGTLAVANQFSNAAQLLTVSTNAASGYTVVVEQNDQMGLNGKVCTGAAGESDNCIEDTTCDGASCNYANYGDWATATNNGLGYSLASVSGTPAKFYWGGASYFYARSFPDQEDSQAKQTILEASSPVSEDQANVCFRISISATQPAGYYYNKVKYTATARF